MLHAACTGTTYCPPSSDVICAMLDIVSSRLSNILFIYLNHQNDKLKLRHALKVFRTRRPEVEIDSVRIQDDIAKVDSTSSRGLAGALLVIKIVGAAAESGLALNALKTLAEETACSVVTYGAALLPSVRRAEHDEPHEQYSKPGKFKGINTYIIKNAPIQFLTPASHLRPQP